MIEIVVRLFGRAFETKLKWPSLVIRGIGRDFCL